MPLIKGGAFVTDIFAAAGNDTPLGDGPAIVSLARFQKERDTLLARNVPLGLRLESSQSPEGLGDEVHHFAVIALALQSFSDGRPFSWARMLRTRMGYKGEIRVTGHFLYDQIAMLRRVGVDAFEVPEGFSLAQYQRAIGEMTNVYQPAADGRRTIRDLRAG